MPRVRLDDNVTRAGRGLPAADGVYGEIREAILKGSLAPGTRLTEEALATRLNVSRTPVREALLRLEAERLAVRAPRRGLIVSRVSPVEILEVYRIRQAIDSLAAELAAESATSADIAWLVTILAHFEETARTGSVDELALINIEFHEAIAEASHNRLLLHFMRQIHDRVRRFPDTTFSEPGRVSAATAEHERVLDAIARRDPASAAREAHEHMRRALQLRMSMLNRP